MVDPGDRSTSADGLRVVALNPWARFGAWDDRRVVLADGLRGLRPDLVAFVEVIKTGAYDQAADLLGPGYHLVHQAGRDAGGAGVSIASRWPVADVHELDLHLTPRTADFFCTTLVAEILADLRPTGRRRLGQRPLRRGRRPHGPGAPSASRIAAGSPARRAPVAPGPFLRRNRPGMLDGLLPPDGLAVRVSGCAPGDGAKMAERRAATAMQAGAITEDEQRRWLDALHAEQAAGRFLAGQTHLFVWGTRPR